MIYYFHPMFKVLCFNFSCLFIFLILVSCKKREGSVELSVFDSIPLSMPLLPLVNEVSGIADSKSNPGYLWAQEDSGNPTRIFLVGHNGSISKSIFIQGLSNRDWEDMAVFNNEIYLAETGDNGAVYGSYCFYHFPEPSLTTDTVRTVDTIRFTYPDGNHDSEAFIIDPETKNIYIITKRESKSRIYRLSYPYSSSNVASFVNTLPYNFVTSAAISPDGKELLIKNYNQLYYYKKAGNESLEDLLQKSAKTLPYNPEPQGEALSFAHDGSGFFTLSEKAGNPSVQLYFYKRS